MPGGRSTEKRQQGARGRCPHGTYWYSYRREGTRVVSKYIGKNLPAVIGEGVAADAMPSSPRGAGTAVTDTLIKKLLDAAGPEHRAGILAEVPDSMRAEVDAIARAEEAQKRQLPCRAVFTRLSNSYRIAI